MSNVKLVKIVQGEDKTFNVTLINKATGKPLDMTGYTACAMKFKKADDTILSVSGSLASADLAKLSFTISDTNTALLKVGINQSIDVILDRGSARDIVKFEGVLTVLAQLS